MVETVEMAEIVDMAETVEIDYYRFGHLFIMLKAPKSYQTGWVPSQRGVTRAIAANLLGPKG